MLRKWAKVICLTVLMSGLCATVQANTTAADSAADTATESMRQNSVNPTVSSSPDQAAPLRLALLLPLRSSVLSAAAEAVRTGFLTASERDKEHLIITIVETGDTVEDILSVYKDVTSKYDLIVGPLSRSAVTALAQSRIVQKPTIVLTQPDLPDLAEAKVPRQMLMMGLSVEDEARQVASWVEREKKPGKIFTIATNTAWQKRAVKAFTQQSHQLGLVTESLELSMPNNALSASGLAQLVHRIQSEKPALLFVALDARQTIELRSAVGNEIALYGTSQLNPLNLEQTNNKLPELNGVYLVDMPWQLQSDHPAVMQYPRLTTDTGARPSADLQRLYALGIDAFRVADEIAQQRKGFHLAGVTGQLNINMAGGVSYFQRRQTPAVYQDGIAIPVANQR